MNNEGITDRSTQKPASGADVSKLHTAKRRAMSAFATADQEYDEALRAFEAAVIAKDAARKDLAAAENAYFAAKAETES